ncbi:hypothetical protein [Streptomyces atratus]|uniref:hypothetical protein n=1 Tax=Streptomyces atratus TaxID=1893 RepID=UPI0033D1FA7B
MEVRGPGCFDTLLILSDDSHDRDADRDDEAVLVRSEWGTDRSVDNRRNPVGPAPGVTVPIVVVIAMFVAFNRHSPR